MNIASLLLRLAGWNVEISVPDYPKCIICVAPHTSNWDFILGKLAYASVGRKAGFLMKEAWFFWPLGYFFRAIGGIAVPRVRGSHLTDLIIKKIEAADRIHLAITPEGTRSKVCKWRTGFLQIAYQTHIPVVLGAIDARTKRIVITKEFQPSGDIDLDMQHIKEYYKPFTGIHPDKFTTENC